MTHRRILHNYSLSYARAPRGACVVCENDTPAMQRRPAATVGDRRPAGRDGGGVYGCEILHYCVASMRATAAVTLHHGSSLDVGRGHWLPPSIPIVLPRTALSSRLFHDHVSSRSFASLGPRRTELRG